MGKERLAVCKDAECFGEVMFVKTRAKRLANRHCPECNHRGMVKAVIGDSGRPVRKPKRNRATVAAEKFA